MQLDTIYLWTQAPDILEWDEASNLPVVLDELQKNRHAFECEWHSRQHLRASRQSRVCEKTYQEKRWQVFEITTQQTHLQSFHRLACMAAPPVAYAASRLSVG